VALARVGAAEVDMAFAHVGARLLGLGARKVVGPRLLWTQLPAAFYNMCHEIPEFHHKILLAHAVDGEKVQEIHVGRPQGVDVLLQQQLALHNLLFAAVVDQPVYGQVVG